MNVYVVDTQDLENIKSIFSGEQNSKTNICRKSHPVIMVLRAIISFKNTALMKCRIVRPRLLIGTSNNDHVMYDCIE